MYQIEFEDENNVYNVKHKVLFRKRMQNKIINSYPNVNKLIHMKKWTEDILKAQQILTIHLVNARIHVLALNFYSSKYKFNNSDNLTYTRASDMLS